MPIQTASLCEDLLQAVKQADILHLTGSVIWRESDRDPCLSSLKYLRDKAFLLPRMTHGNI